jgi:acyl-CoA synthetase (AMP-forming)/AMP-acid ligase II
VQEIAMKLIDGQAIPLFVPLDHAVGAPSSLPYAEHLGAVVFGGYRTTIRGFLERGFRAMKSKIGQNPHAPTDDLQLVKAIRQEVGNNITLMVDVNCGYHGDVATALQRMAVPGEHALLLYPPGLEFLAAFFGCLYAGVLAVPVHLPRRHQAAPWLPTIRADTGASLALTTLAVRTSWATLPLDNLCWLDTDQVTSDAAEAWRDPLVTSDAIAFLQYTSGATAAPKGVMVTHSNILHNERMIQLAFEHTDQSLVVGWLPLYHDMGLIGNVLQPLYVGNPCVLMSPTAFLLKPYRWLEAISRYRATTSGAPNFAYELCVRKIPPEQRASLDLSSWTLAYNGSERVRPETIERFSAYFAPCGFRRASFYPCYGLAEATLFVSGGSKAALPVVHEVERSDGRLGKIAGCGHTRLGQSIVIADPEACGRWAGIGMPAIFIATRPFSKSTLCTSTGWPSVLSSRQSWEESSPKPGWAPSSDFYGAGQYGFS